MNYLFIAACVAAMLLSTFYLGAGIVLLLGIGAAYIAWTYYDGDWPTPSGGI